MDPIDEKIDTVCITILLILIVFFLAVLTYDNFQSKGDNQELQENSKIIEKIKITSRGDFLVFENKRIAIIERGGEDGVFYFSDQRPFVFYLFAIGDFKKDISDIILKSDTLKWYKKAKEHLIR